jgi:type IV pilus assembly protein PilE
MKVSAMKSTKLAPMRNAGFTLIELMIVVAVIGILTAVAYPSYREFIAKGRRADAKTQLLAAQQWMERLYSESYNYHTAQTATDCPTTKTLFLCQPFSTSPRANEGVASYAITVTTSSTVPTTYTLTATRIANGPADGDACGNFTVTHTGIKDIVDETSPKSVATCW